MMMYATINGICHSDDDQSCEYTDDTVCDEHDNVYTANDDGRRGLMIGCDDRV